MSDENVPVFGERVVGQRYVVRPSAYAVIRNDRGHFAVVATPWGRFLPGGGLQPGEIPEQAIVREALEECGLLVRPGSRIAVAVQLVYSIEEHTYFEKPSVFLGAIVERANLPTSESDHQLLWVSAETAAAGSMAHASHLWVLLRAATTRCRPTWPP